MKLRDRYFNILASSLENFRDSILMALIEDEEPPNMPVDNWGLLEDTTLLMTGE